MNLPDIKTVFRKLKNKPDDIELLERRVDELIIHELMKESTLDKYFESKKVAQDVILYTYEISQRDYTHMMENIYLIQVSLPANFVIMGQEFNEECRVMFRINYAIA
jgi:hypothetical protein